MGVSTESTPSSSLQRGAPHPDDLQKQAILHELQNILNSRAFRSSERSKQFLSFVVQRRLEGRTEFLKERLIGAELFHRPASYATGDDPVVRNKASEVRRRLANYYHEEAHSPSVRIELPVGSYVPEFHWNSDVSAIPPDTVPRAQNRRSLWAAAAVGFGLVLLGGIISATAHYGLHSESVLDKFWAPVLNTSRPVLICLAKPVLYRPSINLYRRYAKTHPGRFQTEVERNNNVLPLDPKEKLVWGDIIPYPDFGVAMGDVEAATRVAALMGRINKPIEVRIGNNYSFDDLRSSPAVVIGAFSNRWTMEMTSNLHFVFAEEDGRFSIHERVAPGRVWSLERDAEGAVTKDYGIVSRLLDSQAGQVLVDAAGITAAGSQAAGEVITQMDYLARALQAAPPDWQKKNFQMVVQTNVIDSIAGPPRVVATYFW
jgi:hypothetical protein